MFNEEGKLIVIHEYQPPEFSPFLNPICKNTYNALPKIYGHTRKRKYLLFPLTTKHSQDNRCLRDCCEHRYEYERSRTDVKQLKAKMKVDPLLSQHTVSEGKKKERATKLYIAKQKKKTPVLKQFNSEQIDQKQTKHKVYKPIGTTNLELQSMSELRGKKQKKMLESSHKKWNSEENQSSNESVQTEEKYFEFGTKYKEVTGRHRTKTQPFNSDTGKYYQYLENDPKLKESSQNKLPIKITKSSKGSATNEQDNLSVSSNFLRQRKDSTMFHIAKIKQASFLPPKKSKAYSVLSNGLFKIPEEDQFQDYLFNYKPMDSAFNLKQLVQQSNFHIVPSEDRVYFGQIFDKKRHGHGITVTEKEIYEGKYEEDIKIMGCEKNRDGTYTGEYLRGKRHGKGTFVWVNGQIFDGEWKNGKKNGFGVWKSPKGDYYEGQWIDNRQNGEGYFFHLGGSKYRGQFKDFLKHGKGQEQFPNGDKYNGSYAFGKPHGSGKYTWANGDTYQGNFEQGSRSGFGLLKRISGQVYEGNFKNDLKHGKGKETFKSGESFQGQFNLGQRSKGQLRTSQGAIINLSD